MLTSRVLLPRARLRLAMQPAAALAAIWKAFTLCFVRMTCTVAATVSISPSHGLTGHTHATHYGSTSCPWSQILYV